MALFSKTELKIIEAIVAGKSLKKVAEQAGLKEETVAEHADELKSKLNAAALNEIPEKFRLLTGWSSKPSEYPG